MIHRLNYSNLWNDIGAIFSVHKEAIIPIWGALLFMPGWAVKYLAGELDFSTANSLADFVLAANLYYSENWYIILLGSLLSMFGILSLYALLVRRDLLTIGAALRFALFAFPLYFLVQLTSYIIVIFGFYLFLIPGAYLLGRLAPLSPLYASQRELGYADLFKRCWSMTRGAGWSIFFFLLIMFAISFIALLVGQLILGISIQLLSGGTGLPLLTSALAAAVEALIYLVLILSVAAIFRQLVQQENDVENLVKKIG